MATNNAELGSTELSDKQIADLSPADRQEYFDARADSVGDDGGLAGWLQRTAATVEGRANAEQVGDKNVKQLSSGDDVEYVGGLQPSNADYAGHDHKQLAQFVHNNLDTQQVVQVSDAYHDLHTAFEDFSVELTDAVNKSKGEWEGQSAEQARGYFSGLGNWAESNSQNAKLASETMFSQSQAANTAKNNMPEEVPFDWKAELQKWGDNPTDLIGNIQNSIDTFQKSGDAQQQAAQVMTQYDKDLYQAASKQPAFAEPPKFSDTHGTGKKPDMPGGGDDKKMPTPPPTAKPGEGSTDAAGSGGGTRGGGASVPPTGGATPSPGGAPTPGGGSGGGHTSMPMPAGGGAGSASTGPTPRKGPGTGSVPIRSETKPTGYAPPSTGSAPASGGGRAGFGGMGAMPMGAMGGAGMAGAAGGSEYTSKIGKGGFGPGGTSSGTGSGASSGAAKPGGIGAAEAAAGRGTGASGGAGGGRGAAPMSAMGGRGAKGGEDDEHSRPSFLIEGDPDEIFGTDQRTAPPVIGE